MDWKTRIPALVLWLSLVLSSFGDVKAEKRIVCYYTNWTVYRPGTAKFSPQNINPYLCTHLIYAFGGFTKDNTLKPFDKGADIEKGGYAKFTGLKTYNKDLKTMIAIGGWNEASTRFSPMVADSGRRKEFVKNTVKFLRQNHFDGLDLDWEYPAARTGGKPHDKDNYADLVQELRDEFERESSKTGRPRLLLTMAVPAGITWLEKGYDLERLNDYLDFMNLLTYDYYASTDPSVNHHSPLYSLEEANEYNYDAELTIDFTINYLFKNGVSSDKIVLGIPTYGRSYTLLNEDATEIGSPTAGKGEKGEATREEGYLAYYEICESIAKDDEWEVVQPNPAAMGPYAFRRDQWVGYDDEDIVRVKARYVNEKKLGGIMFWSIDNDDFRGKCHGRPFPLIEAAKEAYLTGETRKGTSVTKTKLSDNRKKTRPLRIQGNAIGRKLAAGKRRTTTTTETSTTRRRVISPRSNGRINGRSSDVDEEREGGQEDEEEEEEEEGNVVRAVEKSRPKVRSKHRSRNRSNAGGRRKQQQHSSGEDSLSNKLTTPEPPTTPDPGGDFKCEEDGFFPHPRDCKKYYWCLDSGPSGLGIVANQFNCPSGLVFNKAADSCDYPRNVVCPKTKASDKSSSLSTTRAPITAATSRTTYLHKSTQRTTTPETESDEEYEYYDDEEIEEEQEVEEETRSTTTSKPLQYKTINRSRPTTTSTTPSTTTIETTTKAYRTTTDRGTSFEDEEDPKVIKELIDLIRKAGGIEQLEKQLHYQEKNSGGNSGKVEENGSSTSATISRSLYERVLNRQATRIAGGFLGPYSTTQSSRDEKNEPGKNARIGFVNGPGGAQFEGLDSIPEVKNLRRTNKPKYVTIERQRQSTSESPNEDDDDIDDEEDDDNTDVASSEDRAVSNAPYQKNSNRRVTSSYVNIRRPRPSTTTSENDVDLKDEDTNSDDSEEAEEPVTQRHRIVKEDEPSNIKSRYTNTQRFRSTTSRDSDDDVSQKPLKNEPTTSTTSTTTTTSERIVPVTEEISEFPIPSTTVASTIPESSSTEKSTSSTSTSTTERSSSSEETSTASISQTTSYDSSLGLVEDSATEILFTTAPASSLSTRSSSETFTRGPSVPAVSQPRPFGFPRRGRPTTTTSATTSSVTSVTEQTRSKVDTETLRLPTLKELVGLTTTAFTRTPSTTTRLIDATIDSKVSREESVVNGYRKDRADFESNDEPGVRTNLEDSQGHTERTKEKEIFDNDILGSEEIQRRSSTISFVNDEGQFTGIVNDKEDEKLKNEKTFRRVVPVTILDENNREEIAELVLLRVPENKLNSAILKPFFRVKILEQDRNETRGDFEKNVDNESQESSENELSENSRRTFGKRKNEEITEDQITLRNRPRNRQRIIKARRRIRLDNSNESNERISNDRRSSQVQNFSRGRDNIEETSDSTTNVTEYFEIPSTTVRATTMRGMFSTTVKSNETRGFYITRRNDETSTISDSIAANFTDSTLENSSASKNDLSVSTREMDSVTRKIVSTTEKIDFTTESKQTVDPDEENKDFTSFHESTTPAESEMTVTTFKENDSTSDQQFTTEKSETVTPYYDTTVDDRFIEPVDSSITTIEVNPMDDLAITTFRPWTRGPMFTTNPTTMNDFTTTHYLLDDSAGFTDDLKVVEVEESTDSSAETLKTSENTHLSRAEFDENNVNTEYKPEALDVENTTESSKTLSDEINSDPKNEVETTTEFGTIAFETNTVDATLEQLEIRSTTVPVKTTSDQGRSRSTSQTEKPSRRTTNVLEKATTYKGGLNRGRVRFSSKTRPSVVSSSTRSQARRTTQSFETEDYRNNLTSQKETNPAISTTESHDKIGKTTGSEEDNYSSTSSEERTRSRYQNSRTSIRGRYSSRKTTKSFVIDRSGSDSDEKRLDLEIGTTTEAYDEAIKSTQNGESSYATTTFEQGTGSPSSSSRSSSLRSVEIEKSSDPTTVTMDYLTTNFVEATGSETLVPENFNSPLATTISLENDESRIGSTTEKEFSVTSIEINDKTTERATSITDKVDYPTTSFVENERSFTSPMTDKIETIVTITENYDRFTDSMNSMNGFVTEKTERDENNETESIAMEETTVNYAETPLFRLDTDRSDIAIEDRKNESINISNDVTTTNIELESLPSTTSSYLNTDHDEIITENVYARTNDRTTIDTTEIVRETTSPRDENNDDVKETTTREFYSTTLPSTIYRSDATTIVADTNVEKITATVINELSSPRELFRKRVRSTTAIPIVDDNSRTTIDSTNLVSSVTDRYVKRTRGRVRFTNFAGSGENETVKNRRPIKQVVVRRRPANDRHRQNFAIPETSTEISQTSNDEKSTNENSKNSVNNFASRLSDETLRNSVNSTKTPRRRVLVYRGRPRNETIATTPSTTTTTTTVQSSSDEISEDRTRRRRKWRKRIVRKRGRVDGNEDDQSIAETRDLRRTSTNDELVDDLSDELAGSWVVAPAAGIVDSEEREDTGGEVNIYKSSGAFLRRPGTLLRTDALNRARLKSAGTSVPATVPLSQPPAIFSKIKSTDPAEEIKTDDQSGRAQELAVTVADPPTIRSSTIGRLGLRKGIRKISTTIAPRAESVTTTARTTPIARRRSRPKSFADNEKIVATPTRPRRPAIIDYDYYVDEEVRLVLKPELKDKLYVTGKGGIKCLDQGNFAHPTSCKKFITCARMVNGQVVGTEYTCPDKLSFDPVGGICNWSAGLGCEEKSNPTG